MAAHDKPNRSHREPAGGALLAWYRPRRRAFPWRRTRDPYAVLVSEVMLQQTQASRVAPAYRAFLRRYPTVEALAAAPRADVVRAWDGLGYNRRAAALSEAAREIVRAHGGHVPTDPESLRRLPGVGSYTAAAVACFAFGAAVAVVDTNVRRVVARARAGREPDDMTSAEVQELAGAWLDRADPGSWNQAVMDLGREACRPRPRCDTCPLVGECRFVALGARPRPSARRQSPFEGSSRQVRGAVVRALRRRPTLSLAGLARETGFVADRINEAVQGLVREGIVQTGPAALAGRPAGRVRLGG